MEFKKFVVVYPGGGLCDMLKVISATLEYAINYNRLLIIDSTKVAWFKHNIHDYLEFNHPHIFIGDRTTLYESLNTLPTYPKELTGCLHKFRAKYQAGVGYTTSDNIPTRFNLKQDYDEDVLIFSNCDMGYDFKLIWKYMKCKPIVLDVYNERYHRLPYNYIGIHIRNTDNKSDVNTFVEKNKDILMNPIFLASDNAQTIQALKTMYPSIITFSTIPDNSGRNIHYEHNGIEQKIFIIDCITDLLLLASGSNYIYSCNSSGYSATAKFLFDNKDILKKVISC
jgi:hypothetical protein